MESHRSRLHQASASVVSFLYFYGGDQQFEQFEENLVAYVCFYMFAFGLTTFEVNSVAPLSTVVC